MCALQPPEMRYAALYCSTKVSWDASEDLQLQILWPVRCIWPSFLGRATRRLLYTAQGISRTPNMLTLNKG